MVYYWWISDFHWASLFTWSELSHEHNLQNFAARWITTTCKMTCNTFAVNFYEESHFVMYYVIISCNMSWSQCIKTFAICSRVTMHIHEISEKGGYNFWWIKARVDNVFVVYNTALTCINTTTCFSKNSVIKTCFYSFSFIWRSKIALFRPSRYVPTLLDKYHRIYLSEHLEKVSLFPILSEKTS